MQTLHHKRNEKQEVEFLQDKECTIPFDFTNAKDLYIELKDGDITPLMFLYGKIENCNVYIPYLPNTEQIEVYSLLNSVLHARGIKLYTLSSIGEVANRNACVDNTAIFTINPNLSKYIPEDNAVLFLSEEDYNQQRNAVCNFRIKTLNQDFRNVLLFCDGIIQETNTGHINLHYTNTKKITIFLPHGTQAELEKAQEIEKELKEKYGVQEVNLCVLHWFLFQTTESGYRNYMMKNLGYNKIITTNSTGILPVQDNERLQVIDCKEIFEGALNGNN